MAQGKSDRNKSTERQLDEALQRGNEDLLDQMDENRNVTGSTTYQTLGDRINDENQQKDRRTEAASPREIYPEDPKRQGS